MFKIGDTRRRDRHTPLLPPVLSSFFFLLPSFLPSSAYSSSSSLASLCFAYVGPRLSPAGFVDPQWLPPLMRTQN